MHAVPFILALAAVALICWYPSVADRKHGPAALLGGVLLLGLALGMTAVLLPALILG